MGKMPEAQNFLIPPRKKGKIFLLDKEIIPFETCKSHKQTLAFALVCLLDVQLSCEIFPVF